MEIAINLDLNQQTIIDVPCDHCSGPLDIAYHPNVVAMTADEKREANRNRVRWEANVTAYLAADGSEDAWKHRTLNLDGMIRAGLI